MPRAVFLDRDGVLSRPLIRARKSYAPRLLRDFKLVPNAAESVRRLKDAGFLVVVVTNQPDIGSGHVGAEVVEQMHDRLRERVAVDAILMCPHSQTDGCECRKPGPGMLLAAAKQYRIDLSRSYMVGDRPSDISAGRSAGCRTVFIDRRYAEGGAPDANFQVRSLQAAVTQILSQGGER